jgi:hypothetical protein
VKQFRRSRQDFALISLSVDLEICPPAFYVPKRSVVERPQIDAFSLDVSRRGYGVQEFAREGYYGTRLATRRNVEFDRSRFCSDCAAGCDNPVGVPFSFRDEQTMSRPHRLERNQRPLVSDPSHVPPRLPAICPDV